jgi:zinc/manganese transport system substrate-binding protein
MKTLLARVLTFALLSLCALPARAADPIRVVAAESVYGDIAQQLGGERVAVTSLIADPAQEPHLFEASPAAARALADARITIANGADYDPWFDRLLKAAPRPGRIEIDVGELMRRKAGDNPHLWYVPATMPAFAKALAAALSRADPAHASDYAARLARVLASLAPIDAKIAAMRARYKGVPVTATEPVFAPMIDSIGLADRNRHFQLAVMNGTEPGAKDIAAFESDLKQRKVQALISNTQAGGAMSQRLVATAQAAKVPVVEVTETLPPGRHFQDWVMSELDALDNALGGKK